MYTFMLGISGVVTAFDCVEQLWGRHCPHHTDLGQNCNTFLSWFQVFLDSCPGDDPHGFHYGALQSLGLWKLEHILQRERGL